VVAAVFGALASTVAGSFPTGHLLWALVSAGLVGLAAVAWLVAGVLGLAARRFDLAALVPPFLLAVAPLLAWIDLPLRARFAAARPAFEDVVAARSEGGPGAACPERIGTYRVFSCVTDGTITLFYTDGGFLDSVGFADAPDGVPAPTGATCRWRTSR
jgi:hypothetical protein